MSAHHHQTRRKTPLATLMLALLLLFSHGLTETTPMPADPDGILEETTNERTAILRRNPRLSGLATETDRGILDHIEVNPAFDYSTLPEPFNTLLANLDIIPPSVTFTDLTSYYDCYETTTGPLSECDTEHDLLWSGRRLALPAEFGEKASEDVDKAWLKFNEAMANKIHEHVNQAPPCVINPPSCIALILQIPQPLPLPNFPCAIPRVITGVAEGLLLYYPTYVLEVFTAVMKHLPLHVSYGAYPLNPEKQGARFPLDPLPGSINAALYKISLSSLEEMLEDYRLEGGTMGGWLDEDGNFAGSREDLYYFESVLKQLGLDLPVILLPSEAPVTFGVDPWEVQKDSRFGGAGTPYMYENVGYVEIWNLTAPYGEHNIEQWSNPFLNPLDYAKPSIVVKCADLPFLSVPVLYPVPAPAWFGKFEHRHLVVEEGGVIPHTSEPMNHWGGLSIFD